MTYFRKIADIYLRSLLFAIWSGICVFVGAGLMYLAFVADLTARGIL